MHETKRDARPTAVVLACRGGAQGDLGLVRSLGRAGVPVVVVSEYPGALAATSRYALAQHVVPGMFADPAIGIAFLDGWATRQPVRPVVFPTADPDLMFLSNARAELGGRCELIVPPRQLVDAFVDKRHFSEFAARHGFRVPRSLAPNTLAELQEGMKDLRYPVIVKPVIPQSWGRREIVTLVDGKKAVRLDDADALVAFYRQVAALDPALIVQEYIPGRDDQLYSLHAFLDRQSRVLGVFTGRKIRTYPAYAGIGAFVESVYVPEIVDAGSEMLRKVGYTGLALMQFKRDPRDGSFWVIEINPRVSSWNRLAAACGVNLPYLAYREAAGLSVAQAPRQRERVKYLYLEHDLRGMREYRQHGEWTWASWLRSLSGTRVFEHFAQDDWRPFLIATERALATVGRRIVRPRGPRPSAGRA